MAALKFIVALLVGAASAFSPSAARAPFVVRPLVTRAGAPVAILDALDHGTTTTLLALFPWEMSYENARPVAKAASTLGGHENDLLFQGFLLFVFPVAVTAFFLTNRQQD